MTFLDVQDWYFDYDEDTQKAKGGNKKGEKRKNLELRILEVGVLNVLELGVLNGLHKISLRLHNKKIQTRMHQEVAHLNTPTHTPT